VKIIWYQFIKLDRGHTLSSIFGETSRQSHHPDLLFSENAKNYINPEGQDVLGLID